MNGCTNQRYDGNGKEKKEKEEEKPVRIIFIYASNVGVC